MNKEQLKEMQGLKNMRVLIDYCADKYGDKCAFSYRENPHDKEKVSVSYNTLRDDVRALSTVLISKGFSGKHIAIVGKNSYAFIVTYFAAMTADAVLVPLDRDWMANDLADTAKSADVACIFADCDVMKKATVMSEKTNGCPIFETGFNSDFGNLVREGWKLYCENRTIYEENPINEKNLALLVFTSGTTGKGKGVMLSQRSIISDMASAFPNVNYGKKSFAVLPPHHTYGSNTMFVAHLMIGCEVYISSGIKYITREFEKEKPEHLVLVPLYLETIYRKIRTTLNDKEIYDKVNKLIRFSNVMRKIGIDLRGIFFKKIRETFGGKCKMIISGGAPLSTDIFDFFESIGIKILNGYGITECSPIIAVNQWKHNVRGSVGPALSVNEVKILEPDANGEGEICVRGENVMLGYYKDEAATKEVIMPDGFFRTGDYGKIDKNGRIFITGRRKNIIILSNGKNVYPEEIEGALTFAPGLLDIVVYEGQSKRGISENKIVAEIYPDFDLLKKREIYDAYSHFKQFIDEYNRDAVPYKKIGLLRIRNTEFPKNTLKKIKRFEIDTEIE